MKLRLFKRAETVSKIEHDRIVRAHEQANSLLSDELSYLRAEHNRRIAPLMAANAARKAAAAKRKAGA